MTRVRGFTLVELIVSLAVMSVVFAITVSVVVAATQMARNSELTVQTNDDVRFAAETIMSAAKNAGMGMGRGVWVGQSGLPVLMNAVFGVDGTTGAGGTPATPTTFERDDLWLVVPNRNAMSEGCTTPAVAGASASVTAAGVGPLPVSCTTSFAQTDILLATNLRTGALLTGLSGTPVSNPLQYAETAIPAFSNAPEKGGFQAGDLVFPVTLVHYYIATSSLGVTNLYRSVGMVSTDALGRPFSDNPVGATTIVASNIEDFQVAYGFDTSLSGDPATYTFQHGLGAAYQPGLRALRITIVGRSAKELRSTSSTVLLSRHPVVAENHSPAATSDGFYRASYSRRAELPNMSPESL